MDSLLSLGLEITAWLQENLSGLTAFFTFISNLGIEEFYLALLPLVYWSVDKRVGKSLAFLFLLSTGINQTLKDLFRGPRPFWLDASLTEWEETGFGVPSNHMQNATIIYFYLASEIKKRWAWFAAVLLVFLMGISRMLLAAHFIHDVLLGFLVALLILGLFLWLRKKRGTAFNQRILGQRLLTMLLVPFVLGILYLLIQWLLPAPAPDLAWAAFIPGAVHEGQEVIVTAVGTLFGFGVGIMMEGVRVRFQSAGPIWQRALRYLLGIIVAILIWAGIRQLTPEDPRWLALGLRFVRYALLTLWISWYGPALFVRLGLADAAPPLELNISLRQPPPPAD